MLNDKLLQDKEVSDAEKQEERRNHNCSTTPSINASSMRRRRTVSKPKRLLTNFAVELRRYFFNFAVDYMVQLNT